MTWTININITVGTDGQLVISTDQVDEQPTEELPGGVGFSVETDEDEDIEKS